MTTPSRPTGQNRRRDDPQPEDPSQRQGALGSSQGDAGAREAGPVQVPAGSDAPARGSDPRTGAPPGQRGKIGSDAASEQASDRAGRGAVSHRQADGSPPSGSGADAERDEAAASHQGRPGTQQNTSSSGRRGGR